MSILGQLTKDKQVSKLFVELLYAIERNNGVECQDYAEIFFPDDTDFRLVASEIRTAKEICRDCPLKNQCAEYAMAAEEPYGIWGGLTVQERNTLRKLKA